MMSTFLVPGRSLLAAAFVAGVSLFAGTPVFAQDHEPLKCPAGSVYRETRQDAGGNDFCERVMPGDLRVNDGPARFWFDMNFLGAEGVYKKGRKVGRWKECDRFERCRDITYPALESEPLREGGTRDLPVRHVDGKYVFDFGSCWSTWITHGAGDSAVDLNVGADSFRCQITYITPWRGPENDGTYLCRVPFAVGLRAFESIDLRRELPKLGLPQFCGEPGRRNTGGPPLVVFAKTARMQGGREQVILVPTVTDVDVECVVFQRTPDPERLVVNLNHYAAAILLGVADKPVQARACRDEIALIEQSADHSRLTFSLSPNAVIAKRQKECLENAATLQRKCAESR